MFDILSNQGDASYVGLNEVEFYGSLVPEPAAWGMILLGMARHFHSVARPAAP